MRAPPAKSLRCSAICARSGTPGGRPAADVLRAARAPVAPAATSRTQTTIKAGNLTLGLRRPALAVGMDSPLPARVPGLFANGRLKRWRGALTRRSLRAHTFDAAWVAPLRRARVCPGGVRAGRPDHVAGASP